MNPLQNITAAPLASPATPLAKAPASAPPVEGSASFKEFFLTALDQVNSMQVQADEAVEQYMTGGPGDPAEVLTAVQKADITFRLMMQVRNKLVQAYQEIKDLRI